MSSFSTNDIIEVGIPKPRCFTFCGNTLNDWLKEIGDRLCETDWSTLDISCLKDYLEDGSLEDQTLEVIVQHLIDATCALIDSNASNCCDSTTVTLTLKNSWTSATTTLATKKDGVVYLQGLVENGSGVITTLPLAYRPSRDRVIPVASPTVTYSVAVLVETNGDISVQTAGDSAIPIHLDLSFII